MTVHAAQIGQVMYDDQAGTLTLQLLTAPPSPPPEAKDGSWYASPGAVSVSVSVPRRTALSTSASAVLVPVEGPAVRYEFSGGAWRVVGP